MSIFSFRNRSNVFADTVGAYRSREIKHRPNFSEKEFKGFIRNYDSLGCTEISKMALKFLILTFVRSCEVMGARWEEIDWDKKEWRIPAERMKMKELHVVPLSEQALKVLKDAQRYTGTVDGLIFPSIHNPDKKMGKGRLSRILRKAGYEGVATPHGMRATASTILNENGFRADVIERQLAHRERNDVRASYNHAQYLQERREMMDWWGNYVESLEV